MHHLPKPTHRIPRYRSAAHGITLILSLTIFAATSLTAQQFGRVDLARGAVSDEYHSGNHSHAMWLAGIGNDFVFDEDARFVEFDDGTAQLTATARRLSNPNAIFFVEARLWGRSEAPPPGSPVLHLSDKAYVWEGGPVDPTTWHYYTGFAGTLSGAGIYTGALIEIGPDGPVFQVGYGASGKNVRLGASNWFTMDVVQQPDEGVLTSTTWRGDFNIELNLTLCVGRANIDAIYGAGEGGHALTLPGIGDDFIFYGQPGSFVELPDRRARLTGIAYRASDPAQAFKVELILVSRRSTAPPGSPKKELYPTAYVENGGPVDPSTWHYYTAGIGTLTGLDAYSGAEVEISLTGSAFQVGFGANGKNTHLGASAWLDYDVARQPYRGARFPPTGSGDFNLDLKPCLEICVGDATIGGY